MNGYTPFLYSITMKLKRGIFLFLCAFLCFIGFAQTYTLGIGEIKFLEVPDPPFDGYIYSGAWSCDRPEISFVEKYDYGAKIKIDSYFSGTATVQCIYVYMYYINDRSQVGSGTITYSIKCSAVPPTSVSLPTEKTIHLDETLTLTPTLTPSNAGTTYRWSSSNTAVATVSSSGVVTPKNFGETVITVTTENNLSATCLVTVEKVNATSISVTPYKKIIIGDSEKLSYNIYPRNSNNFVTWSSSDETVATVTQEGVVTARMAGTADIKVETDNGKFDVCTVTVPPLPKKITLPEEVDLNLNKSIQLMVHLEPYNSLDYLQWSSDNEVVATVDENGMVIGHSVGQARITVRGKNAASVSATCVVNVIEPEYKLIVWAKDGSKVSFRLNKRPTLTYNDGNIVLSTTETIVEYDVEDINKYTFEELDDNTNIVQPQTISPADIHLLQHGEIVLLEQCEPHSIVQIYTINGKLIDSYIIGGDGTLQISIGQYPKGIYIIKTKHLTHKIVKR